MCRLLYLPREFPRDPTILRPWLMSLDKSFGGDGCGFASFRKGVVKGVGLSASQSAKFLRRVKGPLIWHTRRISCGKKIDDLCHPFRTSDGWLAHNGHWHQGAYTAALLEGEWSDSKVAALYIYKFGWEAFTETVSSGVWLHLTQDGCQICYESGDLWVELETGAVASEPCKGFGVWKPAATGTYEAGEPVAVAKEKPKTLFPVHETGAEEWLNKRLSFHWGKD